MLCYTQAVSRESGASEATIIRKPTKQRMSDNAAVGLLMSLAEAFHKRAVEEAPVQSAHDDLPTESDGSSSSVTSGPQKRVRTENKRLEDYVTYSDASTNVGL